MNFTIFLAQVAQADTAANVPTSFSWLFVKTVIMMIIVIAFAFVVLKYLLPRISRAAGKKNSSIKILDYQPLEHRKSVYVLDIDGRKLAVGVTDHHISRLTEWTDKES